MTVGRIPSIEGGIQPTIVDAKGDLIGASAADTPARLAVGANNTVLTADSAEATGLKWATPAGTPALTWSLLSTTAMTGLSSVSFTGLTDNNYFIWAENFTGSSAGQDVRIRFNNSSTVADYDQYLIYPTQFQAQSYRGVTNGFDVGNIDATGAGFAQVFGAQSAGQKQLTSVFARTNGGNQYQSANGFFTDTTVVSSIQVIVTSGTFTAGSIYLYKAA